MPKRKVRKYKSRKSRKPILIAGSIVAVAAIIIVAYSMVGTSSPSSSSKTKVMLITSMGNIVIQLRSDMPITTENFKNLVQQGKYDDTTFHRVIADFMIQGGAINASIPSIPDEFGNNNHNVRGTVAMAKTNQPNSATTQFFINVVDNSNRYASFDSTYSVFGDVIEGMDVVDAISNVATDSNDMPLQPVTIITAQLID
jgi:cyclophilin family peptidyl-prolyl cis-trans isomerase